MRRCGRRPPPGVFGSASVCVMCGVCAREIRERRQGGCNPRCDQQGGIFLSASTESALRESDEGARVGGAERCDLWEEPNRGVSFVKEQRRVERSAIGRVFQDVFRPQVACYAQQGGGSADEFIGLLQFAQVVVVYVRKPHDVIAAPHGSEEVRHWASPEM
eukprot:2412450-Pleurochrysis_carterae.AAC.2